MPKVYTYTTRERREGKPPYSCIVCRDPILPGQERYEWSFRYGGTYRMHTSHGYPRQSMLTQSKMGQVYAAIEAVEDLLQGEFTVEAIEEALSTCAEEIRQVASEYEEAASQFGNAGENQERYEALDSFADSLDSAASEASSAENPEDAQTTAENTLQECPY